MKAEDDCKLERKQTMKLKNAIEKRPSRDVIFELQRENELLKAKIQELDKPLQVGLTIISLCHFGTGKI